MVTVTINFAAVSSIHMLPAVPAGRWLAMTNGMIVGKPAYKKAAGGGQAGLLPLTHNTFRHLTRNRVGRVYQVRPGPGFRLPVDEG